MSKSIITVSAGLLVLCGVPAFGQSALYGQQRAKHYANSLAPYVASPQQIVDRMLELADLKSGEMLYDLGSGDGRVLITAVQRYHAKAVGIEISEALVKSTTQRIQRLGLESDARVIRGDLLEVDLSPADVVTIYLATDSNEILRPNLEKYLKPGARVVSHDYVVPGWKPKFVDKDLPDGRGHVIYLYQIAAKNKKK
jgi:cyclopropane fatty-acyl-phospholipid synthase-like methyltransferase